VESDDFEFIGILGEGSYGKVFLAKKKKCGKYYAIKVMEKKKVMRENK
jgi:serine/threonine protein kinase